MSRTAKRRLGMRHSSALANCFWSICLCSICFWPIKAHSELVEWQGYEIHFTTFSSLLIPAEVAAAHNIARAKNRIVTNISILKEGKPQTAVISGRNSNLLNQLYTMEFTEVKEDTAVYYLANQLIDERDTLRFEIDISPETNGETYTLEFLRTY